MMAQELAYTEIEKLVTNFKNMPATQRRGLNEMQTRLGYILPLTHQTRFSRSGAIMS
jgi:hypothetical protein